MMDTNEGRAKDEAAQLRTTPCSEKMVAIYPEFSRGWNACLECVIAELSTPSPAPEVGGAVAWGWAIVDKEGREYKSRARIADLFGEEYKPRLFDQDDLSKADRDYAGRAPHRIVTLYTTPQAADAPTAEQPVAWRYQPSEVWGDYVVTDKPETAQLAREYGREVTPLYAAPQAAAGHPLDALLPEICQLIDTVKVEWTQQGCWSEWDQSVRDRIAAYNIAKMKGASGGADAAGRCLLWPSAIYEPA